MKQLIILVGTLLLSAYTFAGVQPSALDTALNSALKSQHALQPSAGSDTVYGGQDVSPRSTIDSRSDA